MKPGHKVQVLRLHLGGVLSTLSIDAASGAEMEWYPAGVLVKTFKGKPRNVWYYASNIIEAQLADEAEEEKKRGPGRPPNAA